MGRKTTGAKLEREAVKRYLQQYHAAKQKKRILEERRRTLSAELRGPSTAPAFRATPSAKPVHPDGAGALFFPIAGAGGGDFSARPFYFFAPLFLALKSPISFPLCSFLASLSSAVL